VNWEGNEASQHATTKKAADKFYVCATKERERTTLTSKLERNTSNANEMHNDASVPSRLVIGELKYARQSLNVTCTVLRQSRTLRTIRSERWNTQYQTNVKQPSAMRTSRLNRNPSGSAGFGVFNQLPYPPSSTLTTRPGQQYLDTSTTLAVNHS
jgi:hypothetical protein